MASREYSNFDLLIEPDGDHYRVRILQSAVGEGSSADFKLLLKDPLLEILSLKVGRARRGVRRRVHVADNEELVAAKRFGEILFNAIFQKNIVTCLNASMQTARAQSRGLRVLLRLPADLAQLPWEYLYNSNTNQFLAVSTHTPLVRYFELTPNSEPLEIALPLRLLVAISSPEDYPALNVEREWSALQDTLQPLVERGAVVIDRLEHVSPLDLQAQLRRAQYHVFHFIGHSAFAPGKQNGVLIFNDEHRQGKAIDGQKLGALLADHDSLRLVVLNSCEGARTGIDDPFAGLAQSLVQMGLPAVIAMQYEISDEAAILFACEFYHALADGYGVDAALGDARKAIFTNYDSVEWGTPVLFTRTLDGRIFDLALSTPTAQDLELARLYEDGLSAFRLENWARAQECFQAVVQIRRDYRNAAARLTQAQQQIDLAQRYQQARELLERSDWPGALAILEKLIAEAPDYRDVAQWLQHARQQAQLQALYTDAIRQSQTGEWRAVIDTFAQIAKLQADYPDPQNLLSTARRQEKLANLYQKAVQAMEDKRWMEAQRLLGQLQKTQPGYRDVPRLLEEIARRKSAGWGGKPLTWLAAHRKEATVVGLVLIGLGGVIFVLVNWGGVGLVPSILNSVTPSITPSLTSSLTPDASLSSTPTLYLSPIPSLTQTLSPSPTPSVTLTLTPRVLPTIVPTATHIPPSATPSIAPTRTPSVSPTVIPTVTRILPTGMVFIPAGPFRMGSDQGSDGEKPVHMVNLNAFMMDMYEVTNADYAKCVAAKKCSLPEALSSLTRGDYYVDVKYANYPVLYVSWEDARTYCEWRGARLPTEAEWEKAARGGLEGKVYSWGDTTPVCTPGAENGAQFDSCTVKDTVAVGSFKPNDYGLFDMAGNVWEWVNDWYDSSYYNSSPGINPPGPTEGLYKVVRGGGWSSSLNNLRVAYRGVNTPIHRRDLIGMRCVATP